MELALDICDGTSRPYDLQAHPVHQMAASFSTIRTRDRFS
jgi:hypothetical protein